MNSIFRQKTISSCTSQGFDLVSYLAQPFLKILYAYANASDVEALDIRRLDAVKRRAETIDWIWLPVLAILGALGLLIIAYAYSLTRNQGADMLRTYFYPGLLLMFTPIAIRLIVPSTPRNERIMLVCLAGIYSYLIKPITSPLHFYLYDEFLHWLTGNEIAASGHLFAPNALLPVSPYYPGLENVTSAFSTLSGLNTFYSSLVLIGVARLILTLTMFALNEELFQSPRIGSLATMLYMVNPHYIFFDTQYAYESLALPLALVTFCVMAPYQKVSLELVRLKAMTVFRPSAKEEYGILWRERLAMTCIAILILASVVFTHHATDFFFIALIFLWAAIYTWKRLAPLYKVHLTWLGMAGIIISIAWICVPGNTVVPYLTGFLSSVFAHAGKHFSAPSLKGSYAALTWEKNLAQYSSYFTMACLPFGWLCIWQRYRYHAQAVMLGLLSVGLPASQVLRTSDNGIQLADRAATVLYIAVASVLAVFIAQLWPRRSLKWAQIIVIASVMSLLFMSAYILSGGSGYGSPPTPYVVGADSRSIDFRSIQAATWMGTNLSHGNRIGTDRTNQLLIATFGNQRIVDSIADHVDIAPIFFSLSLDSETVSLMKRSRLQYLVVDERLSTSPPVVGHYYEKSEPGAFMHFTPISLQALKKFDAVPKADKVFTDGSIVIYDVRGITHVYQTP